MFYRIKKLVIFSIRLLILVAILINFWGQFTEARAATFVVDSNQDLPDQNPGDGNCATSDGSCTLRAAIDETNALVGPNTIIVPAMKIVIYAELSVYNHVDDDSVSIRGAGPNLTIIDGGNVTRAFMFAARSGKHSISNLTIKNGNNHNTENPHWNGGAIFNEAELSLTNVIIKNSYAWNGGGVYNQFAFSDNVPVLTLNSVVFDGNDAANVGGGVFNGSVLVGEDVKITNNQGGRAGGGLFSNTYHSTHMTNFTISDNIALEGGGIDNDLGELTLIDGSIDNNVANCCHPVTGAATGGGGIYNNQGVMHLIQVSIANNEAPSVGGYGGGIYTAQISVLDRVSFTNNVADYGSAVSNGNYNGWENDLGLINVTISNNHSNSGSGAGIFNINGGHIQIKNSTITQNYAAIAAGVDTSRPNTFVQIQNSILSGNDDYYGAEDCRGNIISLGNNIVGNPNGNPSLNHPCNFDDLPSDQLNVVPNLGPITGFPAYHPLLPGSPGIDEGQNSGCPLIDIRELSRPVGLYCDIGSYEYQNGYIVYLPFLIR